MDGSSTISQTVRGVAFFDFDGTLVQGDSLLPFLAEVAGARTARAAFAHAVRSASHRGLRGRMQGLDFRSMVKALLLRYTLKGVPLADTQAAAQRLVRWIRWKEPQLEALRAHKAAGRAVVIATGALDLYMPALLDTLDLKVDALLATRMETEDEHLTGRMADGNCVRLLKAERVKAYLHDFGPFNETWGYGNRPSDLPMLELLQNRVIV